MKQGWEIKKLGEICEVQNGYAFDSKHFNSNYQGMPLIRIRDIKRGFSETYFNSIYSDSYIVKKGDFLIGMDGEFNIGEWQGCDALLNQRVCRLIPSIQIITKFIYYIIPKALKEIENKTAYTTVKHISSKQIKDIIIHLPSWKEQERIVGILDSAFAKIEALRANAQQNLQNTKDLFQASIENKFRIKSDWTNAQLNSVADVISGYAFKSGDFVDKGMFQVIRIGNVKQDFLRLTESPIFIDSLDQSILCKSLLQQGDLVITQTGTKKKRDYGFVALVNRENLLLNQRVACVRFKDKEINPRYFLYYSYTEKYKNDFFAQEGGAVGQGNVGLTTIKELNVPFPTSKEEQQSIVKKLDALSERCRAMEENYRQTIIHCNAIKQALLKKAFNGEL